MGRRATDLSGAATLVFAPHPDDETLGCGGTIALKRGAGSAVTIVVMTDGGDAVRRDEAIAAAKTLGVDERDVVFFDYPDRALAAFIDEATRRVGDLIDALQPQEIFIPYREDAHADHIATNRIVHAALAERVDDDVPLVYEYPVWHLCHWPLVDESAYGRFPVLSTLYWGARMAVKTVREFRVSTDLRAVLDVKRAALECHRSQVTPSTSSTPSLADLFDGGFLPLFLDRYEIFHRAVRPERGTDGVNA
jgi:LmbE family N-acetylglucosaminyl deacetylase